MIFGFNQNYIKRKLNNKSNRIIMGAGKIIGGVLLGVGAIAAAPFTGGGSLFAAGVSLSAALGGTAAVAAVGAGVVGGFAGAAIDSKEKKDREEEGENKFNEGTKAGANEAKEKFSSILKTQKERDELMLITIKLGVYVSKVDGEFNDSEIKDLEKLTLFINDNPTTPQVIKNEINKILKLKMSFNEIKSEVFAFLSNKNIQDKQKFKNFFLKLIQTIIDSDGHFHPKEKEFLNNWNQIKF